MVLRSLLRVFQSFPCSRGLDSHRETFITSFSASVSGKCGWPRCRYTHRKSFVDRGISTRCLFCQHRHGGLV